MLGFRFSEYTPGEDGSPFDRLFKLFQEIMLYTSGNVSEALAWLNELDRQYNLTTDEYGMGDFIRDLQEKGYINREPGDEDGGFNPQNGNQFAAKKPR